MERMRAWLEDRVGIEGMTSDLMNHLVPRRLNPLDLLGEVTVFLFINQAVTGILLAMFYKASATTAYQSIQNLMHNVPLGWVIRDLHYWGANIMVVVVFVHMLRGFYVGGYKRPREVTWITGVVLLILTILFAFTGYLLPWDQQSYWATVVGTAMATYTPFIGNWLQLLARGGDYVTGTTLTRFYSVHMLVLPALMAAFIGVHIAMVTKKDQTVVEEAKHWSPEERRKKLVPFWPYTITQATIVILIAAAALFMIALNFRAPLLSPADPMNRDLYQPRPAWYFFSIYYILELPTRISFLQPIDKLLDPFLILGLPLVAFGLLFALPWLDRRPTRQPRDRKGFISAGAIVTAGIIIFTYLGATAPLPGQGGPAVAVAHPSYHADIVPILSANCYVCHAGAAPTSGFNFQTYKDIMALKIVDPGHASQSLMIQKLTGQVPPQMPLGGKPLPKATITTIANWINEGAPDN